jgi:hypothetical protein
LNSFVRKLIKFNSMSKINNLDIELRDGEDSNYDQINEENKTIMMFQSLLSENDRFEEYINKDALKQEVNLQLKKKIKKIMTQSVIEKLTLLINLRAVYGVLYVKTVLKKIELTKQLFLLNLESAEEVLIPKDLSMDKLPASFRFYDPLLSLVRD